jgi:rubrerythrin
VREETWPAQDIESALAIVRQALHNEITGQRFYYDAAYYSIDPWAKEIFASLAKEEDDHTRLLLLEYEALTTQGRWLDLETAQSSQAKVDIARIDFSTDEPAKELFPPQWEAGQAVDRTVDDLAALAFGVKMERAAVDLYSHAARTIGDPVAQRTYHYLVEEETRHYHQLKTWWEDLAGLPFDES